MQAQASNQSVLTEGGPLVRLPGETSTNTVAPRYASNSVTRVKWRRACLSPLQKRACYSLDFNDLEARLRQPGDRYRMHVPAVRRTACPQNEGPTGANYPRPMTVTIPTTLRQEQMMLMNQSPPRGSAQPARVSQFPSFRPKRSSHTNHYLAGRQSPNKGAIS